jgi:hypothetical protein
MKPSAVMRSSYHCAGKMDVVLVTVLAEELYQSIYIYSNAFDATLCIAVFHHLASLDRRIGKLTCRLSACTCSASTSSASAVSIALLRELLRITRVGCEIMIQAWAYEQDESSRWNFQAPSNTASSSSCSSGCGSSTQDVLVPWKLPPRFFLDKSSSSNPDASAEEQSQESHVYQRFCHVFRKGELEDLASSCPGARIMESGWDRGNWFCRLLKTAAVDDLHHHSSSAEVQESDANTSILRNAGLGPTGIMPRAATRL